MNAKNILIPIAAFAVTVTGVSAFNGEMLQKAGLTDSEIAAFEEAKELRESGDKEGARDLLVEAGISEETLIKVHDAMHKWHEEHRGSVMDAVEAEDYEAFKRAIADTPLADIITSESDFEKFAEAHTLIEEGDKEAAKEIFDDLGMEKPKGPKFGSRGWGERAIENAPFWQELSDDQKEALKEAHTNKDRAAIKEILDEAGIDMSEPGEGRGPWHNHDED